MDPRSVGPQLRRANHSPLMRALVGKQAGDIVNACPFGCANEDMDENGFCGHLIGFYNGGTTFEPRVVRAKDGRIITDGNSRQPMKKGYIRVKITTTARVYAPEVVPDLVPNRNRHNEELAELLSREKKVLEFAETIRNPVLDGEWDDSSYDPLAAAAKVARPDYSGPLHPGVSVKPTPAAAGK